MNVSDLIIKCYAEKEEDSWVAVCLNFNLAAQGESFEEVKAKIESMIAEYVYDALAGEDESYAAQLLTRKAPLSFWLRYYFIKYKIMICHSAERVFDEIIPLKPA